MTKVYESQKTESGESKQNGLQALAKKEVRHYTAPLPEAQPPSTEPFPPKIMLRTWAGTFAGGIFGLLFGILLLNQTIIIPGWEALFSMGPFTFVFFWIMIGAALGLLIFGIGAILVAPAPSEPSDANDGEKSASYRDSPGKS